MVYILVMIVIDDFCDGEQMLGVGVRGLVSVREDRG
jgi:hypothetical protein